ncbi:hypothetical protein [Prosthecomicrobium sp. N25]|uniref:hypothetical protein n=1 Tax=Prosthecomicrobium sp. N25 TaxID=3129254 RepID=UPI00307787E1
MTSLIENEAFARVVQSIGPDIEASSATTVDLLFDEDLPVRLTLHPNGREVIVDAFVLDATGLFGGVRNAVVRLLLQLNGLALRGNPFAVGITPAGLVAVTVRAALADLEDGEVSDLIQYASSQATELREVLAALMPADAPDVTLHTI